MDGIRYAENSPDDDEVMFFIYTKGLKFKTKFTQLEIKNIIEKELEKYE